MKKAVTAAILVAFAGAVAFASIQSNNKRNQQKQQKHEKKDTEKKKHCSHTCFFAS